jgi:hypothetical protein
MQFNDLTGQKFGQVTVIRLDGMRKRQTYWMCLCDCGRETSINAWHLRSGRTTSCGCRRTVHGHARKGKEMRTYIIWMGMRERCNNPNTRNYANWGGRGIKVSPQWDSFENFLADMGERPPGLSKNSKRAKFTLERRNNSKGYEPGNCYWATWTEQANNRRKGQA